MINRVMISAQLCAEMVAHIRHDLPMEAVGLLGGSPNGRVARVLPLLNLAGPKAFIADPHAQYRAEQALRESKLVALAVYHSHPEGSALLSAEDIAFAWPNIVQVVIGVRSSPLVDIEIRAYRIIETAIVEIPLIIKSERRVEEQ